jgi:hypothetical protein
MNIKNKLTKAIAVISTLVLTLFPFGNTVFAGTYTARSVSVTNANPSATAVSYVYTFTVANTAATYNHVLITYSVNSDGTGGVPTGINPGTAGTTSLAGTTPAYTWSSPSTKLAWSAGAAQTAGSKTMTLTNVTNPSTTGVFYAKIASYSSTDETVLIDSGTVAVATVPVVTVAGTQLESLSATVAAKTTGTVCSATTVLATTTATAINFGAFTGSTAISAAQTITLGSNATSGVTAKLVENQVLTGPSTIVDFGGGTDLVAGTAWVPASTTGFGVCAKGGNANATNFGAAGTLWKGLTNPQTIAGTAGPTVNTGTDIEFTVAVPANLPAGSYTNQLTYNILANY